MRIKAFRLPLLGALACFVSSAAGSAAWGADLESPFDDVPPIEKFSKAPDDKDECGAKSGTQFGMSAWERGYAQAMSGTHFQVPVETQIGYRGEYKGCSEYKTNRFPKKDFECCQKGFAVGFVDLQEYLLDLNSTKRSKKTPQGQACNDAFNYGRFAANLRCKELDKTETCKPPSISRTQKLLGCVSLGYLSQMSECPHAKKEQKFILKLFNGGVFATRRPTALKPTDIIAPTKGFFAPDGAGTALPDTRVFFGE